MANIDCVVPVPGQALAAPRGAYGIWAIFAPRTGFSAL